MGNNDAKKRNGSGYRDAEQAEDSRPLSRTEEEEWDRMEREWASRLSRYTAPVPSPDQTAELIARVRRIAVAETSEGSNDAESAAAARTMHASNPAQPDTWMELERERAQEPLWSKAFVLLRSQWSVYGFRGWLLTAAAMVAAGFGAGAYEYEPTKGLSLWIHWITLFAVGAMTYAFRPVDEGTRTLERLGHYTPLQQTLARFFSVLIVQFAAAAIVSPIILGSRLQLPLSDFLYSWTAPHLLFAVAGFVLSQWWGSRMAGAVLLALWAVQLAAGDRLKWAYLLATPDLAYYETTRMIAWVSAGLLLAAYFITCLGRRRQT